MACVLRHAFREDVYKRQALKQPVSDLDHYRQLCLDHPQLPPLADVYKRQVVKSTCPMDGFTRRQDMKEMLERLYAEYPMARDNFLLMLHNEKQLSLWHEETADEQAELHPISKSES